MNVHINIAIYFLFINGMVQPNVSNCFSHIHETFMKHQKASFMEQIYKCLFELSLKLLFVGIIQLLKGRFGRLDASYSRASETSILIDMHKTTFKDNITQYSLKL